ncbi:hypothetical protein MRX96_057468 [Rhipicephalus microplus]
MTKKYFRRISQASLRKSGIQWGGSWLEPELIVMENYFSSVMASFSSPGVAAEQHSPVCNHARVNTSQPPVPPLCLTAPALRGHQKWLSAPALHGYWKIDIDSLSSSYPISLVLAIISGLLSASGSANLGPRCPPAV